MSAPNTEGWAPQSSGMDVSEMTAAMIVGGVVLIATPVVLVAVAVLWYVKSNGQRDRTERSQP